MDINHIIILAILILSMLFGFVFPVSKDVVSC